MADFNIFAKLIDKIEGAYQDSPADPGNWNSRKELVGTNHGISAVVYEQEIGRPPSASEMKSITKEAAIEIIHRVYWDKIVHGDKILNQDIANIICDMAINAEKHGIQLAHERIFLMGHDIQLTSSNPFLHEDAINALNTMGTSDQQAFINLYSTDRQEYYATRPQELDTFKKGWENRVAGNWQQQNGGNAGLASEAGTYLSTESIQAIISRSDAIKPDGVPGPIFQRDLKAWQEKNLLSPTGYLDTETSKALHKAIQDMGDRPANDSKQNDTKASADLPVPPSDLSSVDNAIEHFSVDNTLFNNDPITGDNSLRTFAMLREPWAYDADPGLNKDIKLALDVTPTEPGLEPVYVDDIEASTDPVEDQSPGTGMIADTQGISDTGGTSTA